MPLPAPLLTHQPLHINPPTTLIAFSYSRRRKGSFKPTTLPQNHPLIHINPYLFPHTPQSSTPTPISLQQSQTNLSPISPISPNYPPHQNSDLVPYPPTLNDESTQDDCSKRQPTVPKESLKGIMLPRLNLTI